MRADVIVLGGGIIGCALAEELSRRGRRVVVLERGAIGAEASTAAAGILAAQMDIPQPGPFFELCQRARALYPQWVRHLERRSGLSVGYHGDGILYLAATAPEEAAMEARAGWQRRLGLRVERWTIREVRRREPAVDGRFRCGWHFPTEAQVDNVRLMQALAVAARKAGVTFRERTAVRRVLVRGGRVAGVATARGRMSAPVVVNCLGSWANMGGAFPVPLPVEPARGQMLAFRGSRGLVRHAVMSERAYVVQRRDGRLLVGSTIERAGFEKTLTLEGMHAILAGLRRMSTALASCCFLEAWAGFRPRTPDDLPILGQTPIEGLYVATGHFRHGILLAPITARVMAGLTTLAEQPSFDLAPFSWKRFLD
ncbi:MAG: glycine oxidase ThiO [Candidatus Omnitrophica bacterium]|nr:glycine oxidase ThiO [Candidatus Omnitrophota bacterium]